MSAPQPPQVDVPNSSAPAELTLTAPDQRILALSRAGCTADVIYSALWPNGNPSIPRPVFPSIVTALEVADATSLPEEELPRDLEDVVDDLLIARRSIMRAIENSADECNANVHMALCKNADVLLKYQSARQERQIHRLNVRVAQERARIELLELRSGEGGN